MYYGAERIQVVIVVPKWQMPQKQFHQQVMRIQVDGMLKVKIYFDQTLNPSCGMIKDTGADKR